MEIMNHREMEYESKKLFNEHSILVDDIDNYFDNNDIKAKSLIKWLIEEQKRVSIEDIELDYGLDCIRGYLMFEKTPKENDLDMDTWEECSLEGVYKYLCKYYRAMHIIYETNMKGLYNNINIQLLNSVIDKAFIDCNKFLQLENTMPNRHNIYACLMDTLKTISKECKISELAVKKHDDEIAHANANSGEIKIIENESLVNHELILVCKRYMTLVSPFVPYITEQCWKLYDNKSLAIEQSWQYDIASCEEKKLPVQVNGKTKTVITIDNNMSEEQIKELAINSVKRYLSDDYKCIYVEDKIINFIFI